MERTQNGAAAYIADDRKRTLWDRATQRYHEELKNHYNDDLEQCVWPTTSIDQLYEYAKSTADASLRKSLLRALSRLKPGLGYLSDFVSALAICIGVDIRITALIWGSIRLLLMIAAPLGDMLDQVITHLEDLTYTLPKLALYAENLPPNPRLDDVLVDVYAEVIWFCAHTISFFQDHRSHLTLIRRDWPRLTTDLERSIKRLRRHSEQVELEVEGLRHKFSPVQQEQFNALMRRMTVRDDFDSSSKLRCFHVSLSLNARFVQRLELVDKIGEALDYVPGERRARTLAIYGIGGAGKTLVALQYAYRAYERQTFDVVLWISADSHVRMIQDYLAIAQHLELIPTVSRPADPTEAMTKVKAWLADRKCSWLVIFDNADDLATLSHGWPGGFLGSILITTRDYSAASHPASEGLQVRPFEVQAGTEAFLHMLGSGYEGDKNAELAREITEAVGGLPLALNQVSTYIRSQRTALEEFVPLYKRRQRKIHEKRPEGFDSALTVATVWNIALQKLSGDSATLQKLLAFFEPDGIDEALLQRGAEKMQDEDTRSGVEFTANELQFLTDEIDFNDAKSPLFRASLIDRDSKRRAVSLHRLLQSAILYELKPDEKAHYLSMSVRLLKEVFPSSWSDDSDGYVFKQWNWCGICLPHALYMARQLSNESMKESVMNDFLELLNRSAWFLYETESYSDCEFLVKTSLRIISKHKLSESRPYSMAVNFLGLIEIDLGLPVQALSHFKECLDLRYKLLPEDDWGIGVSLSNMGLAYTEMGDITKAMEYHSKALEFRKRIKCRLINNSISNMASLLLRKGEPEEAEKWIRQMRGFENFKDDDFLQADMPRFAGDLVLISMIREAQGKIQEALDTMMKVLQYYRRKFGARFKTCDSLCRIAHLLNKLQRPTAGLIFLEECTSIAASLPLGENYLALAHFRIYQIKSALGQPAQANQNLMKAIAARETVLGRTDGHRSFRFGETEEEAYTRLVPWLLW